MGANAFSVAFPSTVEEMAGPLLQAVDWLLKRNWITEKHVFYARLCLEEALVNAIVHGNASDRNRTVRLEITEEEGFCVIKVFDEGEGFQIDQIPSPTCEAENGRGICLIKHCMDDVHYDLQQKCFIMRMRKRA